MWAADGCELDLVHWMYLVVWNVVETEYFEMMRALVVKVGLSTEMEVWVIFQKFGYRVIELTSRASGRDLI